jgi:hypothetical protein
MTFNTLKVTAGQKIVTIGDVELDRCQHTTAQSVLDGAITISDSLAQGATTTLAITGGTALSFVNSTPFILWDSEVIKVTVDSDIQLTVISRGHFGTIDVAHSPSSAILQHLGEADGSCYGTPFTCNSPDSFEANTKLLFRFPSTQLDLDQVFYNGYDKWSHKAGTVDPGQSMGKRAGATLTIKDSVDNDVYVPYTDRRTDRGTLFTKLIARHPNFEGRPIKIHTGFDPLDLDFANFITREYVIDKAQLKNGVFTISALDPLILSDDAKSKAPVASKGTNTIAIIDASTTITYTGAPAFDYGAATSKAFVRIDSEVIECTVLSDFVLTIDNRAIGGTEQSDHNINATIQECLVFTAVNVVEIIETLLTDFTGIPSSFLDDYTAVKAATSTITLTRNINKPTSVKKLIDELIKNGDLTMFYDEITSKIKIKQVADADVEPININEDDHIGQDSIEFTRDTKNQFTRYSVAWGPNDITEDTGEENFSIIFQSINLGNEQPEFIGEINEKKLFFNPWLTTSNDDVIIGTSIAQRVIDRVEDVPIIAEFDLDIESVFSTQGGNLELGSIINLSSGRAVNVDGSNRAANHQVLSIKDKGGMRYRIKTKLFQDPLAGVNVDFTISVDKEDYDLSTEFAPVAGNYVILIETGVTIGSTSTSNPAFTTGAQAAGVTFDFVIKGSILGTGGAGGNGGIILNKTPAPPLQVGDDGDPGGSGGDALELTVPCTINAGSGAIWSGGGGAGGTRSALSINPGLTTLTAFEGNGGSGASGYVASAGGDGGVITFSGFPAVNIVFSVDGATGGPGGAGVIAGVSGGDFGDQGDTPISDPSLPGVGGVGGIAGLAIVTNGNNVVITSGNNPINIKGGIL